MKKQTRLPIALTLAALLFVLLSTSSCSPAKKEGCTSPLAANYDSDAEDDDGSCTYEGNEVFFWQQEFNDNCTDNEVSSIELYVDGDLVGTIAVTATAFDHTPVCEEAGAFTLGSDLGTEPTKTYPLEARLLNSSGELKYTISDNINLTGGSCATYEFESNQVSW